ncbi:PhoX family protein [Seohaeicola zhoushanensis]|uniref:Transcriptional initiation protein Tat n=1 Tax=Seohaeicola zhoushanensis TaxID=1569283 RepID=A0A8J3M7K8_9RHOB|nr:PhoX family phosphatase [Seohaeicola zhoushanensis]GHF53350.1 transcriptional initiation protein Tat [Seohaeicola zhoushanensis]
MTDIDHSRLSADAWDELHDPRPMETEFDRVVASALTRRGFLSGVIALGSAAGAMGGLLGGTAARAMTAPRFAFEGIAATTDATVHVPEGYEWKTLVRWGDALFGDAAAFDPVEGVALSSSDRVFGENTDGMESFLVDGHQLLAVNSEYTNNEINLPGRHAEGKAASAEDAQLLRNLQGVTVMEVAETAEGWQVVVDSPFNRRITQDTEIRLAGPVAGHALVQTNSDPSGMTARGTFNNCGSGKTPWGTYLTCEENFNGYFGATAADFAQTPEQKRYGIGAEGRYGYELFAPRFDLSTDPNEPNTQGWVVEIDPADPTSVPVKRTALGRFKHENAEVVLAPDGRVVVYMGDDERGEFIYRFVSDAPYVPGADTSELLDIGTLYVAKFNDDGKGEWIALTPEATGMSIEEILVLSRVAGSRVGATTMDRPEWISVNPVKPEAYCALTNNTRRGVKPNAAGDETPVGGPNPREKNQYGQIVRWYPEGGDHAADAFGWDLYVMAGNPAKHSDSYAGSRNVTAGNMFNSPDGMAFDSTGILWIQTDGDDSNEGDFEGQGNNQMLAGDPATGEIRRFLTAPKGAEVTGLCWSADLKTMFVGIQHPDAPFPDGEGILPRSAIIAVKRADDAPVG